MCGRYSLTLPVDSMRLLFGFAQLPNLAPAYNIAPTQAVPVVRLKHDGRTRELTGMRWGLVPSWAKDIEIGQKMINARAETLAEKPAYKHAFRRRRCLIPADGFYEWAKTEGGKQPYRIMLPGGAPFAFAGLWEQWQSAEGSELDSCTIVTTAAAPAIADIHPRMPAILKPEAYETWLSGSVEEAGALLGPYDGALESYRISTRVNAVRNDDAAILEPLVESPPEPPRQPSLFC